MAERKREVEKEDQGAKERRREGGGGIRRGGRGRSLPKYGNAQDITH